MKYEVHGVLFTFHQFPWGSRNVLFFHSSYPQASQVYCDNFTLWNDRDTANSCLLSVQFRWHSRRTWLFATSLFARPISYQRGPSSFMTELSSSSTLFFVRWPDTCVEWAASAQLHPYVASLSTGWPEITAFCCKKINRIFRLLACRNSHENFLNFHSFMPEDLQKIEACSMEHSYEISMQFIKLRRKCT